MADPVDSTPAPETHQVGPITAAIRAVRREPEPETDPKPPSRRGFFASAVAAGLAAARVPLVPGIVADAALFAMEAGILARIARCDDLLGNADYDEDDDAFAEADTALLAETRRLAGMPATTLEGLIFKARFVERGADLDLKASIVADLLAMGDGKKRSGFVGVQRVAR